MEFIQTSDPDQQEKLWNHLYEKIATLDQEMNDILQSAKKTMQTYHSDRDHEQDEQEADALIDALDTE